MKCPSCDYDNIQGVDECEECGQPLMDIDTAVSSELEECITAESISALNPSEPLTIAPTARMGEAVRLMVDRRVGCLVVMDGEELVGVVSERDVLNKVSGDPLVQERPVADFMTPAPTTIEDDDSIAFALAQMDTGGFRHMPVVDRQGRPAGVVSSRDILRYLCQRFAEA